MLESRAPTVSWVSMWKITFILRLFTKETTAHLLSSCKPSGGGECISWEMPFSHGGIWRRNRDSQRGLEGGGCWLLLHCCCHPFLLVPTSSGCGSISTSGALWTMKGLARDWENFICTTPSSQRLKDNWQFSYWSWLQSLELWIMRMWCRKPVLWGEVAPQSWALKDGWQSSKM